MNKIYTPLPVRVRAAIIDTIVFIILMYLTSFGLNIFETVQTYVRTILFLLIVFFYEPILVSIYGATIGHFFNDMVVKREDDESKNISFFNAFKRIVVKLLLGWLSLLTVSGDEKKRAIHDHVAKSVVKPYTKS